MVHVDLIAWSQQATVKIEPHRKITYSALLFCLPGDYDKLWSAATGGRGTGRGRKKKRPQSVDKEMLKFGKYCIYTCTTLDVLIL